MKRASVRDNSASELAAVLDDSLENDSSKEDEILDDTKIEQLANQQETSRKAFDAVLEKTSDEWNKITDPIQLRNALTTVLDQIRGPVLSKVGPDNTENNCIQQENHTSTSNCESKQDDDSEMNDIPLSTANNNIQQATNESFENRAKYIPIRLSPKERKILRLVEAALNVSEYTDVVDVLSTSRMRTKNRIHSQIRDLCSILTGLTVAMDYSLGQKLVSDKDFAHNEEFFQTAFEIARRHKIANPEKSRDTYGKLIHMLQDSANGEITRLLEFSCVKPLVTVSTFLEQRGGLELLEDNLITNATKEIIPDRKSRSVIQKEIKQKEQAVKTLAKRYKSRTLTEDDIKICLYSIGDNNAYLRAARDPCDVMIGYLHAYFKPERPIDRANSLAITDGIGGARLTHDHVRQFKYVFQSLALWREICHEMYKLWYLSEQDLLNSDNPYHLRNTGQGLNRVQAAPNVSRAMYEILNTVQKRVGSWVGSSVVHLGDYNVPNALTFIDKYAQVQRILGPLCTCIRRIEEVSADDRHINTYIKNTFGGVEASRKLILRDFFRHAFDGSGASDWFSAGSCIDGRLTSAWNWCSDIEKKPYWSLFLITGFTGFDGDF